MSLEKIIKIDKIEIVGDYKAINIRQATVITDDGKEISRSFHRYVLNCDADISGEDAEVQAVCNAVCILGPSLNDLGPNFRQQNRPRLIRCKIFLK